MMTLSVPAPPKNLVAHPKKRGPVYIKSDFIKILPTKETKSTFTLEEVQFYFCFTVKLFWLKESFVYPAGPPHSSGPLKFLTFGTERYYSGSLIAEV